MAKPAPFRLNRSALLLALISTAFAHEACAIAARVDFTAGGVTVSGTDGRERPLTRGAELDSGDTVRTTDGRAQLRFTDGSYVSLQPNTEFSIKEYRFDGKTDGSERGFFALARGAMRTVTGLVGRTNRDRYRITTPTATVGIRGTGGLIQIQNDGSTLVRGTSGIWSLSNAVGSIDVPAGTSAKAPPKPETPPEPVNVDPRADPVPVPPAPPVIAKGDEPLPPLVKPLQTGPGYAAVIMSVQSGSPQMDSTNSSGLATFDASGRLTEIQNLNFIGHGMGPGGTHAAAPESGTDGILAWGRWLGPTLSCGECATAPTGAGTNYGPNEGLHYVIGKPTPVMPTQGGGTYTLAGATSPTYTDGSTPGGKFTGSLTVNFAGTPNVIGNFNVAMPDHNYAWSSNANVTGPSFSMSTSTVTGCSVSSCNASVKGFFAGANAERAGVGYHIQDFNREKDVIGTAAFKK